MSKIVFIIMLLASSMAIAANGMDKLVKFWAGTVCEMTNPDNWGDDTEEGPDEHAQSYGYANEAEVVSTVKQYIDDPSLWTGLRKEIDAACPGNVDPDTFEQMVHGLRQQYGSE